MKKIGLINRNSRFYVI